jgi:chromosome segregation ATPase
MISNLKIQVRNFKAEKKGLSDSNQSYLKKIEELESSLTKKDQLINSLRNELVKEKYRRIQLTQQIRQESSLSAKKRPQEKLRKTALDCTPADGKIFLEQAFAFLE